MATDILPSVVTRIMKNAGGDVSKDYKGRIKGLVEHTRGYRSEKIYDGIVRLDYHASSLSRSSMDVHMIREKLLIAQNTLEDKGYFTERVDWSQQKPYLRVRKSDGTH